MTVVAVPAWPAAELYLIPSAVTCARVRSGRVSLVATLSLCAAQVIEDYRNSFVTLALPLFASSEPVPMKKTTFKDMEWSLWDRWVLQGDLTVQARSSLLLQLLLLCQISCSNLGGKLLDMRDAIGMSRRHACLSLCRSQQALQSQHACADTARSVCTSTGQSREDVARGAAARPESEAVRSQRKVTARAAAAGGPGLVHREGAGGVQHLVRPVAALQHHVPQAQGPPGHEAVRAGDNGRQSRDPGVEAAL